VRLESRHLGHIPRHTAIFLAPQLDQGVPWRAVAAYVAVDEDHRERPGLAIDLIKER
jgi:hypothetical protein